jgi:hypothetical protein
MKPRITHRTVFLAPLLSLLSLTVMAADPIEGIVTKAGTDSPAATNEVAIWYPSDSGLAIKLTSFQAVGDNADATLAMYGGESSTTLSAGQTSTNLTVVSTNIGIAAGSIVVLIDPDGDTGWGFVYGTAASTINLDRDPGTFSSGSKVWAMTKTVSTTIASATVTRDAYALFAVKKRSPLMLRLYTAAGTTETLKYATCEYFDPE